MKKASLELSINFIVVIIISVVLLGIGLTIIFKGKATADEWMDKVNEGHKKALIKAMDDGSLVKVYPNSVTINRGEHYIFTLGVSNELDKAYEFGINVYFDDVKNPGKMLYNTEVFNIEKLQHHFEPIWIEMPKTTAKGTYIFNICVSTRDKLGGDSCTGPNDEERYGELQKITVNVR